MEWLKKKRKVEGSKDPDAKKQEDGKTKEEKGTEEKPDKSADAASKEEGKKDDGKKKISEPKPVVIDFKNIHERLRRLSVPNSTEGSLIFSPDGKKLAFSASIEGKRGWYTVEFPAELTPKILSSTTGARAVWTEKAGGLLFSQSGTPAKLDTSGKLESYAVSISQE